MALWPQVAIACDHARWEHGVLVNVTSYVDLWSQWNSSCQRTGVLRRDGSELDSRAWSLNEVSLPLCATENAPLCSSIAQLRFAVENGRREHNLGTVASMAFRPRGCSVPWLPPTQARTILARFSHVLLVGDSLLASTASGLQLLVSGDFAQGMLRPNASTRARRLCTCEGQLSTAALCRLHTELSPHLSWRTATRANTSFAFAGHSEVWLRDTQREFHGARGRGMTRAQAFDSLCSADLRPRFVVLNGGMHAAFNSKVAREKIIDQAMHLLAGTESRCPHLVGRRLVHVVWTGIHAMVEARVTQQYTHQTWNASIRFDNATGIHAERTWGLRSLFFTSLTRGALTIDGVHPQTETALASAHILLRAMEIAADGDMTLASWRRPRSRPRSI